MTGADAQEAIDFRVTPASVVRGSLRLPGDKSMSHRALLLAGLASGSSRISGLADGADVASSRAAVEALGAQVRQLDAGTVEVRGFAGASGISRRPPPLDMGNSGTTTRLLAGMLAGMPGVEAELHGDSSLSRRPMLRVSEPLNAMGGAVTPASHGGLPMRISGRQLKACDLELEVASAQVASALLLAALHSEGHSQVRMPRQVRDHSERMLRRFKCELQVRPWRDGCRVSLVGPQQLQATELEVVGDISSAAFFIVLACLVPGSELLLEAVGVNPTRTGFLDILRRMGASIEEGNRRTVGGEPAADLLVRHNGRLKATDISPEEVPNAIDELPVLLVAAAAASGVSRLRGAGELRHKESDRVEAMAANLGSLGVKVRQRADGMDVEGGAIAGGAVSSFADHRVAMAMTVAALAGTGEVTVLDAGVTAVSLPGFVDLLRQLGVGSVSAVARAS